MIRARFQIKDSDYRPMNWPIKHPYWCTGESGNGYILVAYADDLKELLHNWPDAENIDSEEVQEYIFTTRFKKPEWFKG